jgi:hypothetical protein
MQGELIAPRRLKPDLPEALDALILRCLSHSPVGRPADAQAVLAALEGLRA